MMGGCIFLIAIWSLFGGATISILGAFEMVDIIADACNFEFFNPCYCYKHARVNWFGAFMLALGFALLSPLWAAGFWFYKLCTVGRR